MKFINKVAIITGASRGMGREIALRLSLSGINVVACYKEMDSLAKSIKKQIIENGGRCLLVKGDITKPEIIQEIIRSSIDEFGTIDFLVNNAGIYERKELSQISQKTFDMNISTNLKASLFLCKHVAPIMKKQKFGKIVNISSILGLYGYKYSSHYVSSKAGLIGLTKSLAIELSPDITVNCILPGFIETTNLKKDSKKRRADRLSKIPLNRIGNPKDIAGVVEFLLSKDADYITGGIIEVSGGYSLCI